MTSPYMARVSDFSTFRLATVNTRAHGTRQFLVVDGVAPNARAGDAVVPTRLCAVSDRFHPFFFQVFSGRYTSAGRGIGGTLQGQRIGFEPLMEEVVTPEAVGFQWDDDAYGENPDLAAFLPGWAEEEETVEYRLERPAVNFGEFRGPSSGGKVWGARKVALWVDHDHWVQGYRMWSGWSPLLQPQNWVLVGVPAQCQQAWQSSAYEEMRQIERDLATLDESEKLGHPRMAQKLARLGQRWHNCGETTLARKALEWAIESYMGAEGGGRTADQIYETWNPVYRLGEIDPLQVDGPVDDQFSRYWPSWFGTASQDDTLRDQSVALRTEVDGGGVADFLSHHLGRAAEEWLRYVASWRAWYPSGWSGDERYRAAVVQGAHNCYAGLWREGDWDAYFFDRYGFAFAEGGHATFGGRVGEDSGAFCEQLAAIAADMKDTPFPEPTPLKQYVGDDHAYAFAFADRT